MDVIHRFNSYLSIRQQEIAVFVTKMIDVSIATGLCVGGIQK